MFGGLAVAVGGLDAVVEDLRDSDDAFPVADHGSAGAVAQRGRGGAAVVAEGRVGTGSDLLQTVVGAAGRSIWWSPSPRRRMLTPMRCRRSVTVARWIPNRAARSLMLARPDSRLPTQRLWLAPGRDGCPLSTDGTGLVTRGGVWPLGHPTCRQLLPSL